MKAQEMRVLTPEELSAKVAQWEQELFRARCNKVVGQLQQTHQIQHLRRDIARGKTLLNEKAQMNPQAPLKEKTGHGATQS